MMLAQTRVLLGIAVGVLFLLLLYFPPPILSPEWEETQTQSTAPVAASFHDEVTVAHVSYAAQTYSDIRAKVIEMLHNKIDPFATFKNVFKIPVDWSYPHTNLQPHLVKAVIKQNHQTGFWIEAGSFKAGSAVRWVTALKELELADKSVLLCIDPWTGDAAMWADMNGWRSWLLITEGSPRVFDQFMINVIDKKAQDIIVPMVASSIVGFRVIERLQLGNLLPLVDGLYLDSAHEVEETFWELNLAWRVLRVGGILYGDDWAWGSVRNDVLRFATTVHQCVAPLELDPRCSLTDHPWPEELAENVALEPIKDGNERLKTALRVREGQWFMRKFF